MPSKQTANNDADQLAQSPEGFELKGNLSFSRLNPLAGILARDTKEPVLCGWITGIAYAHAEGEGTYGKFNRIIGEFFALPFNRSTEITATEMFLPGTAERFVIAAIDKAGQCPVRFEGWAFPDDSGRKGGTGYVYKVFVRQPPGVLSAARRMAIECGIIDAPLPPPPLAIEDDAIYDRETGELADGLADLLKGKAGMAPGTVFAVE
jgi:hypothetical protein